MSYWVALLSFSSLLHASDKRVFEKPWMTKQDIHAAMSPSLKMPTGRIVEHSLQYAHCRTNPWSKCA
ncbi:hypothetical protein [Acinetobacter sp. YH16042]|uniref:hypothetical protein n=1 Tax=Acinetobacter sp. YH16042 TaxID=2601186 RepID=UPI0015D240AB|nr:hypothetical protein [Acinetobacter sp. YH16042]